MFILLTIDPLSDDLVNLPENTCHKLTFKLSFTIKNVPDSFTGTVFEDAQGELQLLHFNNPKGNKRKVITLKNKLLKDGFKVIKQCILNYTNGQSVNLPVQVETHQKRISGTPRIKS